MCKGCWFLLGIYIMKFSMGLLEVCDFEKVVMIIRMKLLFWICKKSIFFILFDVEKFWCFIIYEIVNIVNLGVISFFLFRLVFKGLMVCGKFVFL